MSEKLINDHRNLLVETYRLREEAHEKLKACNIEIQKIAASLKAATKARDEFSRIYHELVEKYETTSKDLIRIIVSENRLIPLPLIPLDVDVPRECNDGEKEEPV